MVLIVNRSASTVGAASNPVQSLATAREDLAQGRHGEAIAALRYVRDHGTPSERAAARSVLQEIDVHYLGAVRKNASDELQQLWATHEAKTPSSAFALLDPRNSISVLSGHEATKLELTTAESDTLAGLSSGSVTAQRLVRAGKTLDELAQLTPRELAGEMARVYPNDSRDTRMRRLSELAQTLRHDDVRAVINGRGPSLDAGHSHVDTSYLDTTSDVIGRHVGRAVRDARATDDLLMRSDSVLARAIGHSSAACLDAVGCIDDTVRTAITDSRDYYEAAARGGSGLARVGSVATTLVDAAISPVTAATTLANPGATDAQRSEAVDTALATAATAGVVRGGSTAARELAATRGGAALVRGVGSLATRLGESALGKTAIAANERFTATALARAFDTGIETAGRVNRLGRPQGVLTRPLASPEERPTAVGRAPGSEPVAAASAGDGRAVLDHLEWESPAAYRELSSLDDHAFHQLFGGRGVPGAAPQIASLEGFGAFAQQNPDVARRLVLAAELRKPGELRFAITDHMKAGGTWASAAENVLPHMPTLEPHPLLPGHWLAERPADGLAAVPRLSIVERSTSDYNGFAQLRSTANQITDYPNLRPLQPTQLMRDGKPLTSLDRTIVVTGHGSPQVNARVPPEQLAKVLANHIAELEPGAIDNVVIVSCSQRDNRLFQRSSAARLRVELKRELARRSLPPVEVLAASRPGFVYSGRVSQQMHERVRLTMSGTARERILHPTVFSSAAPGTVELIRDGAVVALGGAGSGALGYYGSKTLFETRRSSP